MDIFEDIVDPDPYAVCIRKIDHHRRVLVCGSRLFLTIDGSRRAPLYLLQVLQSSNA